MQQALILIDIQNDYIPAGRMELVDMPQAAARAADVLQWFRKQQRPIFHIQHVSRQPGASFFLPDSDGVQIHESVTPHAGEVLIQKHFPNSFRGTSLLERLQQLDIDEVVICGAMSHMCVDATTRAAFDFGFSCQVVTNACATRDLVFQGTTISAANVHAAFMAALSSPYARTTTAATLLSQSNQPAALAR